MQRKTKHGTFVWKRVGKNDSKLINEESWTDANGRRHLRSVYDARRLRGKIDIFFKHDWYVKGVVGGGIERGGCL